MNESIIQKHQEATRQASTLSSISMVCGILSIICFITVTLFYDATEDFFIAETSLIAVITGVIALLKIKKYPKLSGKGMAITGLVCGGAIVLYILSFFIVVLVTYLFGGAG
jgi:hypothetical protein